MSKYKLYQLKLLYLQFILHDDLSLYAIFLRTALSAGQTVVQESEWSEYAQRSLAEFKYTEIQCEQVGGSPKGRAKLANGLFFPFLSDFIMGKIIYKIYI